MPTFVPLVKNVGGRRGFSKGLLIGEIGNRDDTIGVFVNPLREGEGFIEELIPTVKEFNFFKPSIAPARQLPLRHHRPLIAPSFCL